MDEANTAGQARSFPDQGPPNTPLFPAFAASFSRALSGADVPRRCPERGIPHALLLRRCHPRRHLDFRAIRPPPARRAGLAIGERR